MKYRRIGRLPVRLPMLLRILNLQIDSQRSSLITTNQPIYPHRSTMMKSILRTTFVSIIACAILIAGYQYLREADSVRQIAELEALNKDMAARLARKEEMLNRIARTRRVAHIEVLEQNLNESGGVTDTTISFIELDDNGAELDRQYFTVPGDIVFIDTWTAKFSHEDVAIGHPMRGRTLVLLRRVYSDELEPRNGYPIDTPGGIPPGYASTVISLFEKAIWENFWEISSNPIIARELGIRVAQGEAVYKPMKTGEKYELVVDAVGGVNLTPLAQENDQTISRASGGE